MAIVGDDGLQIQATRDYMENALREGAMPVAGPALSSLLPPVSRFEPDDAYGATKARVLVRLAAFLERFAGLGSGG